MKIKCGIMERTLRSFIKCNAPPIRLFCYYISRGEGREKERERERERERGREGGREGERKCK